MFSNLKQTFRWFGPSDPVSLTAIGQTGATGVVSALHHIPNGEVWSVPDIMKRMNQIKDAGLTWDVIECIGIHESIYLGSEDRDHYIENFNLTLLNLAKCGINIVCYGFTPVFDWTRTDLDYRLSHGVSALRYDANAIAAFDLFVLKRVGAAKDYTDEQQLKARNYYDSLNSEEQSNLFDVIVAGLQGNKDVLTIPEFQDYLSRFEGIDRAVLKSNLSFFLCAVIPVAEKLGIRMCVHPDDPPFPMLGLPRIISTEEDLIDVISAYPSAANGITFCTGSLGANPSNDLSGMVKRLGRHFHFLHLRNVQHEGDGSFYEAGHLAGSTDMYAVMKEIIMEQHRRVKAGRDDIEIPMHSNHGHKIMDDYRYGTYPGYSAIGRMKGLAELRGLEIGIKRAYFGE